MPILDCEQTASGEWTPTARLVDYRPVVILTRLDRLLAVVRAWGAHDELARNIEQPFTLGGSSTYDDILASVMVRIGSNCAGHRIECDDPHGFARALWLATLDG